MNFITFDADGAEVERGVLVVGAKPPSVPDCGSISFELRPGIWMNARTSEWLTVDLTPEPCHHGNDYPPEDAPQFPANAVACSCTVKSSLPLVVQDPRRDCPLCDGSGILKRTVPAESVAS